MPFSLTRYAKSNNYWSMKIVWGQYLLTDVLMVARMPAGKQVEMLVC
jgi:hypothetical protein